MINLLSIAGYDPSSGAGIVRDADTFFSLGFHGITAPTCTVVQGPGGVWRVHPSSEELFRDVLEAATGGVTLDGVKIGALCDEFHVKETLKFLKSRKNVPIVLDPVFRAKNGVALISERGRQACVRSLFKKVTIVTPNAEEASLITGRTVRSADTAKRAAETIHAMGPKAVVIKGGHFDGDPVDVLFDGRDFALYKRKRIGRSIHGTGCSFSSALVCFLARGCSLQEAFMASEFYLEKFLRSSYRIDRNGYFYISSAAVTSLDAERWMVINRLMQAKQLFGRLNPVELIPDIQMNICYALPGAKTTEDIAAFPGSIGRHEKAVQFRSDPRFGASSHVARLVLTCMRHHPHVRCAAIIRYDGTIIKKAEMKKLYVEFYDRMKESKKIKWAEEKSLDYLVDRVLKKAKRPPDIIYDRGAIGKEPIIRLFAKDPLELIEKMEMIRP